MSIIHEYYISFIPASHPGLLAHIWPWIFAVSGQRSTYFIFTHPFTPLLLSISAPSPNPPPIFLKRNGHYRLGMCVGVDLLVRAWVSDEWKDSVPDCLSQHATGEWPLAFPTHHSALQIIKKSGKSQEFDTKTVFKCHLDLHIPPPSYLML